MPASRSFHLPILQGVLPIKGWQVPAALIAGFTLAALAGPEAMGPGSGGLYAIRDV